ncbi:hypothetical protein [Kordia sp.]|uniref:hypothetical protein n=1 Tax=Kordia sp. TaxID=1965332 RepID=UPI003D2D6A88
MHDDGCFTGCATIISFFLFFFALWGNIESNIHKKQLYLSKKNELYTVKKISDTIQRFEISDGERFYVNYIKVWTFTLNDSLEFSSDEKKYNLGDNLKRFYYVNQKRQRVYSDYYSASTQSYSYNTFWESLLFILYVLFFIALTIIMYILYFDYVKEKYDENLKDIPKVNVLDKISNYLVLNKIIILVSIISIFLLIHSLNFYFKDIPETSFDPAIVIFICLIGTFLIPIVFIQILRNKEKPNYRNSLNVIRISLIISSALSLLLTLVELTKVGSFKETTMLKTLSETLNILKDLFS